MRLRSLEANESGSQILFECFLIEEIDSFSELLEVYQKIKNDNLGKSVILTLDILDQSEYTSNHAILFHDLDDTEGYDLSGVDPAAFEDGEHIGYLSTPSEFFIRKQNFLKKVQGIGFSDACERGLIIEEDEILILEKVNNFPVQYLDKQVVVKIVPVSKSYEAVCGFPNGYFSSDLSPFENYALAKHFYEKYGFELMGIGASLLGFIRHGSLDQQQKIELCSDLGKLYNSDKDVSDKLINILNNNFLFIKYTDSI